jgi:hypothetical protein
MGVGDRADDRESQAGAARGPGSSRIGAVEALEHALALGGRDPGAVVDHGEADSVWRNGLKLEPNQAVRRGSVLDRVPRQVSESLRESVGVREQ